ncbi:multiple PDZ domain protein-like isoform X2 [Paramacrobiotus metropolitanus]|uniref:multiple PDZ domain protein-like isoform X2 n=1 Tax=Paramacrobiotus metropolitanus TaxID=2943436 RepID=UPI00244608CF|nr:multiple PDZ domain protein-like isoform X2 [Paramacrobiotus metropolitanus]
MMSTVQDARRALVILENIQKKLRASNRLQVDGELNKLIGVLESPVFRGLLQLQDSITQINHRNGLHEDSVGVDEVGNVTVKPPLMHTTDTFERELVWTPPPHQQSFRVENGDRFPELSSLTCVRQNPQLLHVLEEYFRDAKRHGQDIVVARLEKREGRSLGFSVAGMRVEGGEYGIFVQDIQPESPAALNGRLREGDQIVAINGVCIVDSHAPVSHQDAVSLLQRASGLVELVLARNSANAALFQKQPAAAATATATPVPVVGNHYANTLTNGPAALAHKSAVLQAAADHHVPVSASSSSTFQSSRDSWQSFQDDSMVLNSEWAQVEVIDLLNDGSGLGFGITGGRSTGVVIKTILPGSVAHRDGRLRLSDHILFCNAVALRGMGSDQVAAVLRQTPDAVRLIVARNTELVPEHEGFQSDAGVYLIRSADVHDQYTLERILGIRITAVPAEETTTTVVVDEEIAVVQSSDAVNYDYENIPPPSYRTVFHKEQVVTTKATPLTSPAPSAASYQTFAQNVTVVTDHVAPTPRRPSSTHSRESLHVVPERESEQVTTMMAIERRVSAHITTPVVDEEEPLYDQTEFDDEMDSFEVELTKDQKGLGITIAGFVGGQDEISGIFVKSIAEGSAADIDGRIRIHDQIVQVDGARLEGFSNHDAVQLLRNTGQVIRLKLVRYLRGRKRDQLEQYFLEEDASLAPPNAVMMTDRHSSSLSPPLVGSATPSPSAEPLLHPPPDSDAAIMSRWRKILGSEFQIIVAHLLKQKEAAGLGISLEGTVDVEGGRDVRPHHYLRSIHPDGPVGCSQKFLAGDELLEVNGIRLFGVSHKDCVVILKELPLHVRMVCARRKKGVKRTATPEGGGELDGLPSNHVGGLGVPGSDRLVKAKSDGSLAIAAPPASPPGIDQLQKLIRSRSLEPLAGLVMWSNEATVIELNKGDRGLGFSILDYQDPMNPEESVIVIRSLVPGGVAQLDGRLRPGDRLLWVNDINLENAVLERAVEVLKGAPKGIVRIGVAKPLPITDTSILNGHYAMGESQIIHPEGADTFLMAASADDKENTPQPVVTNGGISGIHEDIARHYYRSATTASTEYGLRENTGINLNAASTTATGATAVSAAYQYHSSSATAPFMSPSSRTSTPLQSPRWSPMTSPSLLPGSWGSDVPYLPPTLEKTIKVNNQVLSLGLEVDVVEKGMNGCVVRRIEPNSALHSDKRLQPGDYVTSIHHESLRRVVKAQAHAIIRRASLLQGDISITYIPAADAAHYRQMQPSLANVNQIVDAELDTGNLPDQTSPRSPFFMQRQMQLAHVEPIPEKSSPLSSRDSSPLPPPSPPPPDDDTLGSVPPSPEKSLPLPPPPPPLSVLTETDTKVADATSAAATSSTPLSALRHWGPPRVVKLEREPNRSLGISIVGGKVEISNSQGAETTITGIFIKQVLAGSPAGREGTLKTGDRILEVAGVDLRDATHEHAVDVIRSAESPVTFLVQSLVSASVAKRHAQLQQQSTQPSQDESSSSTASQPGSGTSAPSLTTSGTLATSVSEDHADEEKLQRERSNSIPSSTASEPVQRLRSETKSISKESSEESSDSSGKGIHQKYGDLGPGELIEVEIPRGSTGLGLSLVGNKDRQKMSVFVLGVHEDNTAARDARIQVGDEILEVNNLVIAGRSHLNASAMIKGLKDPSYRIVLLRRPEAVHDMALPPGSHTQFLATPHSPTEAPASTALTPHNETAHPLGNRKRSSLVPPSDDFVAAHKHEAKKEEVVIPAKATQETAPHPTGPVIKTARLFKGAAGLGFGVSQGHEHIKEGIFVKTITEHGVAHQEGTLQVGDQIISVNGENLVGQDYNRALNILCRADKDIHLTVSRFSTLAAPLPPSLTPSPQPSAHDQEITVDIHRKSNTGLGLKLSVLPLETAPLVVREIYPEGCAGMDGRLKVGDRLLWINEVDVRHCNSVDVAMGALVSAVGEKLTIKVLRDGETLGDEDLYQTMEVELVKRLGKGLGLSIVTHGAEPGVYISEVVKGGESEGRLLPQDQILEVNGQDLRRSSQEMAATVLKAAPLGKVHLKIRRLRTGITKGNKARRSSSVGNEKKPHGKREKKTSEAVSTSSPTLDKASVASTTTGGPVTPGATKKTASPAPQPTEGVVNIDFYKQGSDPLGFQLSGPKGALVFGKIAGSSPAFSLAQPGDRLVALNGASVEMMTQGEINAQLKQLSGKISMVLFRGGEAPPPITPATPDVKNATPAAKTPTQPECRTIVLQRGQDGLGFSIVRGIS